MLACIAAATLTGAVGQSVSVEVHVSNGLPGFTIVGLPDAAVRESRDRVRAALLSSGLPWPLRRVTVNLAPVGRPQGGCRARPGRRRGGAGGHGPTSTGVHRGPGVLWRARAERLLAPCPGHDRPGRRHGALGAGRAPVRRPGGLLGPRRRGTRRVIAGRAGPDSAGPEPRGPPSRPRHRPRRRPTCPTWPMSGDSPSGATPSRWRRPGATTC